MRGSQAFALTDHQVAHIYLPQSTPSLRQKVRNCLESMDGVDRVVEGKDREQFGLNHERSGDLIAFAEEMHGSPTTFGKMTNSHLSLPDVLIFIGNMVTIRQNFSLIPKFPFLH